MATVTYMKCDHCDIEASSSGVGIGNVRKVEANAVSIAFQDRHEADLCVDCEKELRDAITRWMTPKKGMK